MTKPPPKRQAPPPEGSMEWLTEDIERPRYPHFSIWRALGIVAAMIAAFMIFDRDLRPASGHLYFDDSGGVGGVRALVFAV